MKKKLATKFADKLADMNMLTIILTMLVIERIVWWVVKS